MYRKVKTCTKKYLLNTNSSSQENRETRKIRDVGNLSEKANGSLTTLMSILNTNGLNIPTKRQKMARLDRKGEIQLLTVDKRKMLDAREKS